MVNKFKSDREVIRCSNIKVTGDLGENSLSRLLWIEA